MTSITPTVICRTIERSAEISRQVHDDHPERQRYFDGASPPAVITLNGFAMRTDSALDANGEPPFQEQIRPTTDTSPRHLGSADALVISCPSRYKWPLTEVIRITEAYRREPTHRRFVT